MPETVCDLVKSYRSPSWSNHYHECWSFQFDFDHVWWIKYSRHKTCVLPCCGSDFKSAIHDLLCCANVLCSTATSQIMYGVIKYVFQNWSRSSDTISKDEISLDMYSNVLKSVSGQSTDCVDVCWSGLQEYCRLTAKVTQAVLRISGSELLVLG